jgi:CheY-like chemotaxis protein
MAGERIALVEDSEVVRRFASRLLRHKGFEVDEYPDGQAALEVLATTPSDLVVSDIQMPRMDGLELTRQLRQRYEKRELPIVLVSVLSDEEDIVAGFEAGANDYLIKPYRTAELLAKIAVLLRERTFLRANSEPELPVSEGSESSVFERPVVVGEDETQIRPVDGLLEPQSAQYFFDQYRVTGEYGRGGMGTVYEAVRRSDEMPVALKVLAPRLSGNRTAIARFLRECRLLASMGSQNVVRVLDHGYDAGRYFLVMEAVDGESLDRTVLRDGPMDQILAGKVFAQIGRALEDLSEHDLIHRDVKPANIIVRRADQVAKLVDFGLAKHNNEATTLTDTGYALGTSYYVAPEVVEGGKADARSDLFALGVSMFEVLTGRRPFSGVVPYQIFKRIVSGEVPHPREFRGDLAEGLVTVILKLLSRDPADRYASGAELEEALQEWLGSAEATRIGTLSGSSYMDGPPASLFDSSVDTPSPD